MTSRESDGQAGRPPAGQITTSTLADGTHAFRLRFQAGDRRERATLHERRDCSCGCGGGWNERTARVELDNILARVRAGVWPSRLRAARAAASAESERVPTFHEYASWWLTAKTEGVIGDKPIDANTQADYRWRLTVHLLPFFGGYRLDEIDRRVCLRFKETKLRESEELRRAISAGADLRDRRGRRITPLGLASIKKLIDTLGSILDEAIEDEHIERNPARGESHAHQGAQAHANVPRDGRARAHSSTPPASRTSPWIGHSMRPAKGSTERAPKSPGVTARACAPRTIAAALGLSKATVSYHLVRLGVEAPREYQGRRAICGTLARSGIRASELCDLRVGEVRLHDPEGARVPDPRRQDRGGRPRGPDEPRARRGVRLALRSPAPRRPAHRPRRLRLPQHARRADRRQRVARIVGEAATRASERVSQRGLPPLPHTTPHTLRRTYISIALLANRFDVLWVMGQVGHADSKMTLDVYAQLQQRVKREHGRAFDTPRPAGARAALRHHQRTPREGAGAQFRPRVGPRGHLGRVGRLEGRADRRGGSERLAGGSRNGETRTRTGDTTIFSRVLYQLSYLAVMG